ncbi:MAG: hypothetical protein ABSB84_12450 [Verrucomicrobiota bacterium]|jgi:hypothetical protein
MANTYTQIYIHVVFAVEGRQNLIKPEHNSELQKKSREEIVPRGIHRAVGKVRCGLRPAIHFQNRRGMIF